MVLRSRERGRVGRRRHLIEKVQSVRTLDLFVAPRRRTPAHGPARLNLALPPLMDTRVSLAVGAVAGAALIQRERKSRKAMERFAAAALETLLNAIEANDEDTGMHV